MTQEELKEILHYDPETGIFTWKIDRGNLKIKAGRVAGCNQTSGKKENNYHIIMIKINQKRYLAHRLAFLYMTGKIPKFVDHKDFNSLNNKWENLREATDAENKRNRVSVRGSRSVFKGVTWATPHRKLTKPWKCTIQKSDGESLHLGYFLTEEEAARAYDTAALEHHKEFARLNFPIKTD